MLRRAAPFCGVILWLWSPGLPRGVALYLRQLAQWREPGTTRACEGKDTATAAVITTTYAPITVALVRALIENGLLFIVFSSVVPSK